MAREDVVEVDLHLVMPNSSRSYSEAMATVMAQQEDTMAQQYQANMAQQGVAPTLIHPKFQRFVEFKKNDPPQFKDTTDLWIRELEKIFRAMDFPDD